MDKNEKRPKPEWEDSLNDYQDHRKKEKQALQWRVDKGFVEMRDRVILPVLERLSDAALQLFHLTGNMDYR